MKLAFANPRNMTISPLNMHHGRPAPDVSDIRPSIGQRGILVPMLVLEKIVDGAVVEGHFEVVAGARRLTAALAEIASGVEIDPAPIVVLAPGDDAAAIEASLLENLSRLPPDEVSTWETFAKLVKKGRTIEEIAATFSQSETVVRRTLALGNLLPRIRNLYRREAIEVATVRALTLASKGQQKEWLAMFDDPQQSAPTGAMLRAWLFGGAPIAVRCALFCLDDYPGAVIGDLFAEDSYFTDPALFWTHQNQAIADKRDALLAQGWSAVEVLETGRSFETWKHEQVSKDLGGKVFIAANPRGEVRVHEGWLSPKEARRALAAAAKNQKGASGSSEEDGKASTVRAEVSSSQQAYIDLHRHAAVRATLVDHPGVALRLLVAHAVVGSPYWQVEADPRRSAAECVAQSLEASPAEAAFRARRTQVAKTVGLNAGQNGGRNLVGQSPGGGLPGLFVKLLSLPDADVLALAAVVIGETLASGSEAVEAVGLHLKVDTGAFWSPDAAFFELIRDRETLNAMLAEVGGKKVADGNVGEKLKTQKIILRDCLDGSAGRPKAGKWTPKWLTFPAGAYTKRPLRTAAIGRELAPLMRKIRVPASPQGAPEASIDPAKVAAE